MDQAEIDQEQVVDWGVGFVDIIPKTASGKILRKVLKERETGDRIDAADSGKEMSE